MSRLEDYTHQLTHYIYTKRKVKVDKEYIFKRIAIDIIRGIRIKKENKYQRYSFIFRRQ